MAIKMKDLYQKHGVQFFCLLGCLFAGVVYTLGVNGPFLFDDFYNLQGIAVNGGIKGLSDFFRYVFGAEGYDFSRSVARMTFILNSREWPVSPYYFKLTNIGIHIVNAFLIGLLLKLMLVNYIEGNDLRIVVCLSVVLWVVHPLHVSTVLYVVQRMTELMTLFSLLSLISYCYFRQASSIVLGYSMLFMAGSFAVLAALSKENAAVILVFYALLEFFCFQKVESSTKNFAKYISVFLLVVFFIVFTYFVLENLDFEKRFYTWMDRLSVQGKVLWSYIGFVLFPNLDGYGLYHDEVEWNVLNKNYSNLWLYWLAHFLLIFCSFIGRKLFPVFFIGVCWFYIGHIVESTFLPLEMMYEHRNYFPSIGIILIIAYGFSKLIQFFQNKKMTILVAFLLVFPIAFLSIKLAHRTAMWSDYYILTHKWWVGQPDSQRSMYAQIRLLKDQGFYKKSEELALIYEKKYKDLTVPLFRLEMICDVEPSVISGNAIDIERYKNVYFNSGVNFVLSEVLQSKNKECIERNLKNGGLYELISMIENMPLLMEHKRYYAAFLDVIDNFYIAEKDYVSAFLATERMWETQPTVNTGLKLVELLVRGGNYSQAKEYLEWVEEKNDSLWFVDEHAKNNIKYLSKIVNR